MPGNSTLPIRVQATTAKASIRRIADDKIKAPLLKMSRNLSKVAFKDLNLSAKAIGPDIMLGQFHQFRLDFQPHNLLPKVAVRQDQGYHPAARSQVQDTIVAVYPGEPCQQYGVNRETISPLVLMNDQFSVEEPVECEQRTPS